MGAWWHQTQQNLVGIGALVPNFIAIALELCVVAFYGFVLKARKGTAVLAATRRFFWVCCPHSIALGILVLPHRKASTAAIRDVHSNLEAV